MWKIVREVSERITRLPYNKYKLIVICISILKNLVLDYRGADKQLQYIINEYYLRGVQPSKSEDKEQENLLLGGSRS